MKRFLTILMTAVLLAVPAAQAQSFHWTISNSTTDPFSNSGPIAPGPSMFAGNLYLWLSCQIVHGFGMAWAEMDVAELRGGGAPTGFTPMNGFLNAGTPTALLLTVGSCPQGPVLAGVFAVGPDGSVPDIELCLVPSARNNWSITVDCDGVGYFNGSQGFAKTGGGTCLDETCRPLPVEGRSWGRVKSLFR